MSSGPRAVAYPTPTQYDRWKDQADALDMSVSEFIQAMTEAGLKKFEPTVEPDETNQELRRQRNDLKTELDQARDRICSLEDRLHQDERSTVRRYVENNPGATFEQIVQHVTETVPERVNRHLDELEGETLRVEDGVYHPVNTDTSDSDSR